MKTFYIYFILSIISKILASTREFGIGYFWGSGVIVDSFILGMLLPVFFIDLINVLLNSSYISILISSNNKKKFSIQVFFFILIYSLISSIFVLIFLKLYVTYIPIESEILKTLNSITLYIVFYYILMVISEFFKAHLLAIKKQKLLPIPILISNIIFIFVIYFIPKENNHNSLIYCFVIAAIIQLSLYALITKNSIINLEKNEKLIKDNNSFISFIKNIPIILIGTIINQSNKVTDKIILSVLGIGGLSSLYFSQQFYALFINVITFSILTFTYPIMCEKKISSYDGKSFIINIENMLFAILIFIMTISLFLADDIFDLILKNDADNVSLFYKVMAITIIFESLALLWKRVYWSIEKVKITVYINVITALINISFSLILSYVYGIFAIAFSYLITNIINAIIYYVLIRINREIKPSKYQRRKFIIILTLNLSFVPFLYFIHETLDKISFLLIIISLGLIYLALLYKMKIFHPLKEKQ